MNVINTNPTIYLGDEPAELIAEELERRDDDDDASVSGVIQDCIIDSLGGN